MVWSWACGQVCSLSVVDINRWRVGAGIPRGKGSGRGREGEKIYRDTVRGVWSCCSQSQVKDYCNVAMFKSAWDAKKKGMLCRGSTLAQSCSVWGAGFEKQFMFRWQNPGMSGGQGGSSQADR